MNLEELKSAWQVYDRKLQASQAINEKLIFSMIRERSNSRVSRIKKENTLLLVLMFLEFFLLLAVFAGNPFDFRFLWQYLPFLFILLGNLIAIVVLFRAYKMLKTDITDANLRSFLKNLIATFESNKKAEGWFGVIMFVSGCLTIFSFLPHKLATKSLSMAIIDTLIPLAISVVIYLIAYKMGAFNNQKEVAFKKDLSELEKLQQELQEN
ncbi:hypothetical protein [Emticicia oligotrophica]|uniref:hypothetical protein n=1 Tax=Emticicia oligotrophica TaxID=312279 RepID=UPI00273BE307|nr:hypothetical protein [Emticicia oligotrophica]